MLFSAVTPSICSTISPNTYIIIFFIQVPSTTLTFSSFLNLFSTFLLPKKNLTSKNGWTMSILTPFYPMHYKKTPSNIPAQTSQTLKFHNGQCMGNYEKCLFWLKKSPPSIVHYAVEALTIKTHGFIF